MLYMFYLYVINDSKDGRCLSMIKDLIFDNIRKNCHSLSELMDLYDDVLKHFRDLGYHSQSAIDMIRDDLSQMQKTGYDSIIQWYSLSDYDDLKFHIAVRIEHSLVSANIYKMVTTPCASGDEFEYWTREYVAYSKPSTHKCYCDSHSYFWHGCKCGGSND